MNLVEASRLLAKVSGNDGRQVGESTVLAWQETLADVPYPDAMAAVSVHYRESTDFLMPAHLVALVTRLRTERRQAERDQGHDERLHAYDKRAAAGDLPPATRKAVEAATGANRPHNLTLRRRDMAGTSWAFSCTCGINPVDQNYPDKAAARTAGMAHVPQRAPVG